MDTTSFQTLARRQHGAIHRRQLTSSGLDSRALQRRVSAGHLSEVTPHVFVAAGAPPTWHQQLWVSLLSSSPGSVVSHRSAARLHGIGPFRRGFIDIVQPGEPIHAVTDGDGHRTLDLPKHHCTIVDGLPATTVARTVFDLAGQASMKRRRRGLPYVTAGAVERTLDDALSAGTSRQAFASVLHEIGGRGRGGTVLMRELLAPRGEGFHATESELEDLVVAVIRRAGLPAPERQRNLGDQVDRSGRVDFVYVQERVVIEADGRKHHTALVDQDRDRWRDLELAAAGFIVVRVTWRQLSDQPARFAERLRQLLHARNQPTTTPNLQ